MSLQKKGFTLIELLVVISIIGLLASIVITGLGSAKVKARIASAQSTMNSLQPALRTCLSGNLPIQIPPTSGPDPATAAQIVALGPVCAGGPNFPVLPSGWIYCDGNNGELQGVAGCGNDISFPEQAVGAYTLTVESHADMKIITCTETSCIITTENPPN